MTADVRLFLDKECTKELAMDNTPSYLAVLSSIIGLNGYAGDSLNIKLYLKNCGTRGALYVTLNNKYDTSNYVQIRTSTVKPDENKITVIGDIPINGVVPIYFCVSIPRYTTNKHYVTPIYLDYYTLPEKDIVYYNPYANKCDYCTGPSTSIYSIEVPPGTDPKDIASKSFYVTIGEDTFVLNPLAMEIEYIGRGE